MIKNELTRIDRIVIDCGSYGTIVLTPDEARNLRDYLCDVIGPKVGNMPYYTQQPIWIDPNSDQWPNKLFLSHGNTVDLIVKI